MNKIESFKINHKLLEPGIYVSRYDKVGDNTVTTFDIRLKRPNFEDCMTPAVAHTIEHLGATFMRNDEQIRKNVIFFGPMGCLTGFYLLLSGYIKPLDRPFMFVVDKIRQMLHFIVEWNDDIPGATPMECGNYRMNDLDGAKLVCANMLVLMEDLGVAKYEYPTKQNSAGICDSCHPNKQKYNHSQVPDVEQNYEPKNYVDEEEIDSGVDEPVTVESVSSEEPVKENKTIRNPVKKQTKKKKSKSLDERHHSSSDVSDDWNIDASTLEPVDFDKFKSEVKTREIKTAALF